MRLVMMSGVAPGIGKSTLATSLARALTERGMEVDLFGEEELFTRAEFADVARGFRTKDYPSADLFLAAYSEHIGQLRKRCAWGIFDWNCAAMAGDLPWALESPESLVSLVRSVRAFAIDLDPVALFLDGSAIAATQRAACSRGPTWVAHWARIAAEQDAPAGSDLERIAAFHARSRPLREVELAALRLGGWEVIPLDATGSADGVLHQAERHLGLT